MKMLHTLCSLVFMAQLTLGLNPASSTCTNQKTQRDARAAARAQAHQVRAATTAENLELAIDGLSITAEAPVEEIRLRDFCGAIRDGNVEQVADIIASNQEYINSQSNHLFYRRPLAEACRVRNVAMVKLLLDEGASPDYVNFMGMTPLQEVVLYYGPAEYHERSLAILKLLLAAGANPNHVTSEYIYLGLHGCYMAGSSALMIAAARGNYDAVRILLDDLRVKSDLRDKNGHTALDLVAIERLAYASRSRCSLFFCSSEKIKKAINRFDDIAGLLQMSLGDRHFQSSLRGAWMRGVASHAAPSVIEDDGAGPLSK